MRLVAHEQGRIVVARVCHEDFSAAQLPLLVPLFCAANAVFQEYGCNRAQVCSELLADSRIGWLDV